MGKSRAAQEREEASGSPRPGGRNTEDREVGKKGAHVAGLERVRVKASTVHVTHNPAKFKTLLRGTMKSRVNVPFTYGRLTRGTPNHLVPGLKHGWKNH